MKRILVSCFLPLLCSISIVQAQDFDELGALAAPAGPPVPTELQYFQKYQAWASENHQNDKPRETDKRFHRPRADHRNTVTNYEDIKHAVRGDFNGDNIPELGLMFRVNEQVWIPI